MARTTDELIDELARDSRPVRRLASPLKVAIVILAGTVLFLAALLVAVGFRFPERPWVVAALTVGGALFAYFAARAAVPGLPTLRIGVTVTVVGVLAATLFAGAEYAPESLHPALRFGASCFAFSVGAALLPLTAFFVYLKRGHVLRPRLSGGLAGASAVLLSLGALEFHCSIIEVTHLGFGHLAPLLVMLGAGAFVLTRLIDRPGK